MLYADQDQAQKSRLITSPFAQVTFSQFGEDLMMLAFIETAGLLRDGFYVDVGAHHPYRMSNTALLYETYNWRGINIEANPEGAREFRQARTRDITVEAAVSDGEYPITFEIFNHSAVSSADPEMLARQKALSYMEVTQSIEMTTRTLASILTDYMPARDITLLSVDVEGFDLKALQGNDWARFSPKFVLVEDHEFEFDRAPHSAIHTFLYAKGYSFVSRCVVSSLYRRP